MNRPRVDALHYRVVVAQGVDYDKAPPIEHSTDEFDLHLGGDRAHFQMKKDYASVEEARAAVETFIRAWEILIGLEASPGELKLKFDHADLTSPPKTESKESPPGNHIEHLSDRLHLSDGISTHLSRGKYPPVPKMFRPSATAACMYDRYAAYCSGRERLPEMANYCLTAIEVEAGSRRRAAVRYKIAYPVLTTLGRLAAEKGGEADARKHPKDGKFTPITYTEGQWMTLVVKAIIRRAGEDAYDRSAIAKQLTMKDFPALSEESKPRPSP